MKHEALIRSNLNVIRVETRPIYKKGRINPTVDYTFIYICPACGKEAKFYPSNINKGFPKACVRCSSIDRITTHGDSQTRLYHIYYNVLNRCNNPKHRDYANYGGRGIVVDPAWNDWLVFKDWALASEYQDGLTIERIDVNKGYSPGNCMWIEKAKQPLNRRCNIQYTHNGVTKYLVQWCEEWNVDKNKARSLYKQGSTRIYEELCL